MGHNRASKILTTVAREKTTTTTTKQTERVSIVRKSIQILQKYNCFVRNKIKKNFCNSC